jgi:hypothetical protein
MDRAPQPVERPIARHRSAEQALSGHRAERHDDPRPDHRHLLQEMVAALRDLIDAHVAITRWPTSKRTGDEDGIARQTDRAQHRIEQLSCRTGERQALSVSLLIWRTADDHPICSPITGSEHRLRAPLV